jgi:hypothetical protein
MSDKITSEQVRVMDGEILTARFCDRLADQMDADAAKLAWIDQLASARAERETFHMEYRQKCDVAQKAAEVKLAQLQVDVQRIANMIGTVGRLNLAGAFTLLQAAIDRSKEGV